MGRTETDRSRALLRTGMWLCAIAWLAGTGVRPVVADYDKNPVMGDVTLNNPAASEVWLAGSDHTLTCSTVTDQDCNLETGLPETDYVTHWWTSTSGEFPGPTGNIGVSVKYVCNDVAGTETVHVRADDHYPADGSTDGFLADDLDDPRHKQRDVTVSFVYGTAPPNKQENETSGQAFGTSWPYTSPTMTSTTNFPNYVSYESTPANDFYYKVTTGSNAWIHPSPRGILHNLCVVAAAPSGGPHYEWVARASCRMADGQASDDAKTIVDDIYDSLATYACADDWSTKLSYAFPDTGLNFSVDSLLDDKSGSCGDWRQYFLALCNVQGVDSTGGLKSGDFRFDNTTKLTHPWEYFRVEHKGINNSGNPSTPANYRIVDDGEYPNPAQNEVHEVQKAWWVLVDAGHNRAFGDHSIVFMDVAGDNDSLYDPSFPSAGGSPVTVTYPGATGYKTYTGTSNFMTAYFESSCPYLYGDIDVDYDPPDHEYLHVHTNDFDNAGATPANIRFCWGQF